MPERMAPPPNDDDDDLEVTRASVDRERRLREAKAKEAARKTMTRRSWYVTAAAADAFQAAVDDIHHSTRVPKHEVLAALLEAAVGQSDRVERKLTKVRPAGR